MPGPFDAVNSYFLGKDGNRPFLFRQAFNADAELEMVVNSDAISFPARAKGLPAIEDVLCRRFATEFENVFTFCLERPNAAHRAHFPCHWLVGMSGRVNGPIRVGSGRYDWYFTPGAECRIRKAVITIDVMQVIPAAQLEPIMGWLSGLPYPWCSAAKALESLPAVDGLQPVEQYLKLNSKAG